MADTIEASERDLMAQTLRRLAEQFDGEPLSKALADFGFSQLLEEAPREAVSALFDTLGRTGSTSAELHDVLLQPLTGLFAGATGSHCVVLPRIGAAVAGSLDRGTVTLRGLVIGKRPARVFLAPVTAGHDTAWVSVADSSALTRKVAAGLDSAPRSPISAPRGSLRRWSPKVSRHTFCGRRQRPRDGGRWRTRLSERSAR